MPAEIEATVVICDEDPERISADIEGLEALGTYRFSRRGRTTIEDVYFDSPDGILKETGWALRIRRTDDVWLLTAKGPGHRPMDGVAVRNELESPWSREGLSRVLPALPLVGERRIVVSCIESDPVSSLVGSGLVRIHHRTTRRHTADLSKSLSGNVYAELAVDRVTYRFPSGPILHWEVEIEAKGKGNSATVSEMMRNLLMIYGGSLRKWDYGKLATGSAVQRLIEEGSIENLIGSDRRLLPGAYDLIEALLGRGRCPGINVTSNEDCANRE